MKWLTRLHRAYSHKASIYRQSMLCSKKKSIGKHRRTSRHKYSMVFLHTKTFFVSWLNHQDVYNESWLQESLEKVFCPSVHIVQPGCLTSYTRWKPSVSRSCVSITREDSDSKQHTINLTFHFLAQSQGQIDIQASPKLSQSSCKFMQYHTIPDNSKSKKKQDYDDSLHLWKLW